MKVLEGKGMTYEVLTYPVDLTDAEQIAAHLGKPAAQVLKTLVVPATDARGKAMLVMAPANRQLDLKKLAAATGAKKLKMATHREAEALTGLQVGGISALALLNKRFRVILDASAAQHDQVAVSAGQRGVNLWLAVADLIAVTYARVVDVAGD